MKFAGVAGAIEYRTDQKWQPSAVAPASRKESLSAAVQDRSQCCCLADQLGPKTPFAARLAGRSRVREKVQTFALILV